jgi:uncharacterized membrane protein YbhN (UPF0104 family)
MKKRLVRLLAWAVTAGLLVLLFHRIPFHEVLAAARGAAPWAVPATLLFTLMIYLGDSFAIWKTFGWFLAPLSFSDVLLVRGATYLLAAINYNVGQGAIVYFVHRVARVPVMRGVATVLLIMGVNVLALLLLATFGLVAAPAVPPALRLIVAVAYAGLAVYAVAVAVKPRWLANRPLFDVLLGAGLGGHARALLVRLPHIASLFATQIVMLRAFGVAVPVLDAIAALPVVFFIAVLPISVQGLGTTQATMIYFFARYAPGDSHAQQAAVLAASLVTTVCISLFQAVLGVACLRSRVGRALTAASAEAQSASTVAAPS